MAADAAIAALCADAADRDLSSRLVIASWAEAQANAHGSSLRDCGLRLFDGLNALETTAEPGEPADLGHLHERLLSGETRKRRGVHLTPGDVAGKIVALLDPTWQTPTARVLDPSVGGGAFLLAAADALVAAGHDPQAALQQLHGIDIDPVAVAVAEAALALWGVGHGLEPAPLRQLVVGDGLLTDLPSADVVVGNPPFLNQLRASSTNAGERRTQLREQWPNMVTAYTDEGWLFLAAAVNAVADGGQVSMVQPVSVLAARHGDQVRAWIEERAALTGLWVADGRVFEAVVEVCAPVLRRGAAPAPIRRWSGREFVPQPEAPNDAGAPSWGRVGAVITGVPDVELGDGEAAGSLGDLARVTAGFRDQFYGFAPYVHEAEPSEPPSHSRPKLVTVGMIDPFMLRWGSRTFKFAGNSVLEPLLGLDDLHRDDPTLANWTQERLQPKVLVATQTRVIEACADPDGLLVPATPVISVEPFDGGDLWRLLAVVMSPPIAAALVADNFGTAMSVRAVKVSARDIAGLPLPVDDDAWAAGAELAHQMHQDVSGGADAADLAEIRYRFGETMAIAHGFGHVDGLVAWWCERWPSR